MSNIVQGLQRTGQQLLRPRVIALFALALVAYGLYRHAPPDPIAPAK